MNSNALANLAILTLTSPAEAAKILLALRPGREVLWLAFFLAVVVNGLVHVGMGQIVPPPDGAAALPPEPVFLGLLRSAGAMLLSVLAFLFVGRMFGGEASFEDIMVLTVWLQFLQIAALLLTLIVSIALPFLMVMLLLATGVISLYVTLHFLNEAHKFQSLGKSFGVIAVSALVAVPFVLVLLPSGPV